jgi:hypothetical protein
VRALIFARNFGHQLAVTAGLDHCRGRAAIIIDSDLQDPPEVMADLIAKWHEGYEVVYAVRAETGRRELVQALYRLLVLPPDLSHHGCQNPARQRRFSPSRPPGGGCPEDDAGKAPFSARHVGLGGFPSNGCSLSASSAFCRTNQIPPAQNAQVCL